MMSSCERPRSGAGSGVGSGVGVGGGEGVVDPPLPDVFPPLSDAAEEEAGADEDVGLLAATMNSTILQLFVSFCSGMC